MQLLHDGPVYDSFQDKKSQGSLLEFSTLRRYPRRSACHISNFVSESSPTFPLQVRLTQIIERFTNRPTCVTEKTTATLRSQPLDRSSLSKEIFFNAGRIQVGKTGSETSASCHRRNTYTRMVTLFPNLLQCVCEINSRVSDVFAGFSTLRRYQRRSACHRSHFVSKSSSTVGCNTLHSVLNKFDTHDASAGDLKLTPRDNRRIDIKVKGRSCFTKVAVENLIAMTHVATLAEFE